jgi:rRNA maturation protein Nop10
MALESIKKYDGIYVHIKGPDEPAHDGDFKLKKEIIEEETELTCEKCGSPMVVKTGRYGKFLACSNYPDCKNIQPLIVTHEEHKAEETAEQCPKCGNSLENVHPPRFSLEDKYQQYRLDYFREKMQKNAKLTKKSKGLLMDGSKNMNH